MVSPNANATAAGHRRYWRVLALALLPIRRARRTFVVNRAAARSGYYVRLLLRPAEQGQPAGNAEAAGGGCPFGWYQSGAASVVQSLRCGHGEWPLWALAELRSVNGLPSGPSAEADVRGSRVWTWSIGRSPINRCNKIYQSLQTTQARSGDP
jgi:hypothetical protein